SPSKPSVDTQATHELRLRRLGSGHQFERISARGGLSFPQANLRRIDPCNAVLRCNSAATLGAHAKATLRAPLRAVRHGDANWRLYLLPARTGELSAKHSHRSAKPRAEGD